MEATKWWVVRRNELLCKMPGGRWEFKEIGIPSRSLKPFLFNSLTAAQQATRRCGGRVEEAMEAMFK